MKEEQIKEEQIMQTIGINIFEFLLNAIYRKHSHKLKVMKNVKTTTVDQFQIFLPQVENYNMWLRCVHTLRIFD